jgi:hypothetical protein
MEADDCVEDMMIDGRCDGATDEVVLSVYTSGVAWWLMGFVVVNGGGGGGEVWMRDDVR